MQDTFTAIVVILHVLLASARNVLIVNSVMVMCFFFPNLRFLQGGFLGWFKGRYLSPNLKITSLAPPGMNQGNTVPCPWQLSWPERENARPQGE